MSNFIGSIRLALPIAVIFSCVGCGSVENADKADKSSENKTLSEKLVGNWKGKLLVDEEAVREWAKAENIEDVDAEIADMKQRLQKDIFRYFAFKDDGTGRQVRQSSDFTGFDDFKWDLSTKEGHEGRLVISFQGSFEHTESFDISLKDENELIAKPILDPEDGVVFNVYQFERVEEIPQGTNE